MRVSIWQQFSRNNSSYFTIVGVFPSADDAQQASEKVREIMTRIEQWHNDNPEQSTAIFNQIIEGTSEVEQQIAQTYDIEWNQPMWWSSNYHMLIQENLLVLTPQWGADSGAYPIDALLQKFGASVAVDGEVDYSGEFAIVRFEISCVAPDESAADFLVEQDTYKTQILPIPGSQLVQVKIGPRRFDYSFHFDEQPELFTIIGTLKQKGFEQIEVKLTSQVVGASDYDDLGDELENEGD